MANPKATCSPASHGPEIRPGKKVFPVSVAASAGGSWASTSGPSRCSMGLYPRNAANSTETGGGAAPAFSPGGGPGGAPRPAGRGGGRVVRQQPVGQRRRQRRGQSGDHQREEDADREHLRGVLEGRVHPAAG